MRSSIVMLVGVLIAAFGLSAGFDASLGWRDSAANAGKEWRLQRLDFLQAAYRRLDAELARRADDRSVPSARAEIDAVRRLMVETARPLPVDDIPPDIRHLLRDNMADGTGGTAPRPVAIVASAVAPAPRLRSGLGPSVEAVAEVGDLPVDPMLRLPFVVPLEHRKARRDHPSAEHGADARHRSGRQTRPQSVKAAGR